MASAGWEFEMAKIRREHVHKVSHPTKVAGLAEGSFRGPKGAGVPPTGVQMPRRARVNVKPPKMGKRG